MQIDFNIMKEFCKMLELMDKSKTIKHFMWATLFTIAVILLVYLSPELIRALIELYQAVGA